MDLPTIEIEAARIKVILRVETELDLGAFPGNTIRSGLGAKLRKVVCVAHLPDCTGCILTAECAYPNLFETGFRAGRDAMTGFEDAPKPYIIHFPECFKRVWSRGESFKFELILIGDAISYLPHLAYAIRELGRSGLGIGWRRGKGRCTLEGLEQAKGISRTVLYHQGKLSRLPDKTPLIDSVRSHNPKSTLRAFVLTMVTPLRLRKKGRWIHEAELIPAHLFEAILRRIEVLSMIYGEPVQLDKRKVLNLADRMRITRRALHWHSQGRFSARTRKTMPMDGILGEMTIEGPCKELAPYLRVGELLHVGKGATMGMGQFKVKASR